MDVVLPKPGTYVLAISGGVDSRVLLDILHKHSQNEGQYKFVIAHLDHGIRPDSADDRRFVQTLAREYKLPFVYDVADLGSGTSEAQARTKRYAFLGHTRKASNAQAVITAHHQDDLLETAILNLIRGSGRKGMTALGSDSTLLRPLLGIAKTELIRYAKDHDLTWHEDSTNDDDTYLRNYVRHNIVTRIDDQARAQFLTIIENLRELNQSIDALLAQQLAHQEKPGTLARQWFNSLPHSVAKETLASWLRTYQLRNFDSKTLERLVVNAKVARSGRHFPLPGNYVMKVGTNYLALEPAER